MMRDNAEGNRSLTQNSRQGLSGVALNFAVFVVIFWLGMLTWLTWESFRATDEQWSRLLALQSSLEAITFAAAGALFGTRLQRQRVSEAQDRADKAEKESAENRDAAIKGRTLAAAVRAEARPGGSNRSDRMSSENRSEAASTAQYLAAQFFPE